MFPDLFSEQGFLIYTNLVLGVWPGFKVETGWCLQLVKVCACRMNNYKCEISCMDLLTAHMANETVKALTLKILMVMPVQKWVKKKVQEWVLDFDDGHFFITMGW